MTNRYIIVDQLRVNYEGLFDVSELFNLIDAFFFEKGYDRFERKNEQIDTPDGKSIVIELRPWKKITDYARIHVAIRIFMTGIKDVQIEQEGIVKTINHGKIQIILDGVLDTDWQNKWKRKPIFTLIGVLLDKYIFKNYTAMYKASLLADVNQIHGRVKDYLNMYKHFQYQRPQWG